jgi:hypothetical protein
MLFVTLVHIDKQLVAAYFAGNMQALCRARAATDSLRLAFTQAASVHARGAPVKQHSQQLYAGLTYSGAELAEYVELDPARGFKA